MTSDGINRGRLLGRAICLVVFLGVLGIAVAVTRPGDAGAEAGGALVAEPQLSATDAGVRTLLGATPGESPGEVWGISEVGGERLHFVHFTEAGGWDTVADPVDPEGHELTLRFQDIPPAASAGRTTPAGGVVALASTEGEGSPEDLLIRDPGGAFRAIPAPPEPILEKEEELFLARSNQGKVAAVEEPDGRTGAFVVPDSGKKLTSAVLHYDGNEWSREPICLGEGEECEKCRAAEPECAGPEAGFSVLAVEAAGPGDAWILARSSGGEPEGIILLKHEAGIWRRQTLGGELGEIFARSASPESEVGGTAVKIEARKVGQPLTVTTRGVWVDATVQLGVSAPVDATIYFDVGVGDPREGEVSASWCDLPESAEPARGKICTYPLGSDLAQGESRSFAWPGSGAEGDYGTRAITGVGQGAMLVLENGSFAKVPLAGNGGTAAGAALSSPEAGWLGPSYRLTRAPVPSGLQAWPLPFRRPLTAVVAKPGTATGSLSTEALAVGSEGEVARYLPGVGWQPESLLTGSGTRATPELRAVAWPEPGFAYAVGDEGAMWLWRGSTGFWEPDPGAPTELIRGDFTGIAFDPSNPGRGYAVGKQGLLLGFGKGWTPEALPAGLNPEINLTSIAFAGSTAIATWTLAVPGSQPTEPNHIGGIIVNEGSGWRSEEEAATVLATVEGGNRGVAPRRVAGLADGGAVIAGLSGAVIERETAGGPWHAVPGAPLGYPAAVAAIREGGQVRALVSAGVGGPEEETDRAQALAPPAAGRPPLLTEPYPLPISGFLVRQTATGWRDEERADYPQPPKPTDQPALSTNYVDLPREADPVLGILVNPEGSEGWVVGGQTGENAPVEFGASRKEGLQTASVQRYGPAAAPPQNEQGAQIPISESEATFAIGGNAQCAGSCADLANVGIGPDVWLRSAVARAAGIGGVRAFLYTGTGVSEHLDKELLTPSDFAEEEAAYARRLDSAAGSLPVFTAPSETDLYESSLSIFGSQFSGFPSPLGLTEAEGVTPVASGDRAAGNYSYTFNSANASGEGVVRVIVLDQSTAPVDAEKRCWLAGQLAGAKEVGTPAIVIGNREVGTDTALEQVLVTGNDAECQPSEPAGASAFFYKLAANRTGTLRWENSVIPSYGTGTLGYSEVAETSRNQFVPPSGFLLASVNVAGRSPTTNVAPVSVRLVPNIGSLAIDALDGTLLRRSQTALFEGLARRPIAGSFCAGNNAPEFCSDRGPDPYVAIPSRCFDQPTCPVEIQPEYKFSSSRPDIADFVEVDPNSSNPRAVFLNEGKPVPDSSSGLLCAFNSGSTTVTLETGGLSYSVPVTVQAGSVARPCGTVPRTDIVAEGPSLETEVPAETPKTHTKNPAEHLKVQGTEKPNHVVEHEPPPPPPPPAKTPQPQPPHVKVPQPVPPLEPVPVPRPHISPVIVIPPPPPVPAVEPTPPTGTSPVVEPASSPEPEEEEEPEAAFEQSHNAVAVQRWARPAAAHLTGNRAGDPLASYGVLGVALIAALAGGGAIGARRRRPDVAFAQTTSRRRPR